MGKAAEYLRFFAVIALCLPGVSAARAGPWEMLDDPHLAPVPRTPEEAARIAGVTRGPMDFSRAEPFEGLSAGAATVRRRTDDRALSQPAASLPEDQRLDFELGRALFEKLWVGSPSSTRASDGLGPLYNARSCARCHVRDGRGFSDGPGLVLRLSAPGGARTGIDGHHAMRGDPVYGRQLQTLSLSGLVPEGRLDIRYETFDVALSGGETVTLRRPVYAAVALSAGPLGDETVTGLRIAPPMPGLGLLEAIPAQEIIARADPEDADGDGISGRVNVVRSVEYGQMMLGRFGWKAAVPTVSEQAAAAFSSDVGISTPLFPWHWGDCTVDQPKCQGAPHGGDPEREGLEVDSRAMGLVNLYARNLAVPERPRVDDPDVLRGKQVFHDSGCAACHQPSHVTHRLPDSPARSFQLIWPYTDLLLHDMGPGLADGRPEGRASGEEWRTAPLWGIGLVKQVGGREGYLHDGRAQSLLEAILWHGGEAETARDKVVAMPADARAALLEFLGSL